MILNKKLITIMTIGVTLSLSFAPTLFANTPNEAVGVAQYSVNETNNTSSFDAKQTGSNYECKTSWDVTGNNDTLAVTYNGSPYNYSVNFVQNGNNVTGSLTDSGVPITGPVTGTVYGNTIKFSFNYLSGSIQGIRKYSGTINASGSAMGTWTETGSEHGSGTWTLTPNVTKVTACPGKGKIYTIADGTNTWYQGNVTCASVSGSTIVFSGRVVEPSATPKEWFIAKAIVNSPSQDSQFSSNLVSSDPECDTTSLQNSPVTLSSGGIILK